MHEEICIRFEYANRSFEVLGCKDRITIYKVSGGEASSIPLSPIRIHDYFLIYAKAIELIKEKTNAT